MSGFIGGRQPGQLVKCDTCHHHQVINPRPAADGVTATPPVCWLLHLFTCSREDVISKQLQQQPVDFMLSEPDE